MLEVTDWAREILRRSHEAARRFDPDARIRIASTGRGVEGMLTDSPEPGDEEQEIDGITILVEPGLEGLLDIEEPHDRLVLRPAGSTPNAREHDHGA